MKPRIAVVGSLVDELAGAPVLHFETPRQALEARAGLVVMREADWARSRDEAAVEHEANRLVRAGGWAGVPA